MVDRTLYEDDSDLVRERLRRTMPGDWYVFETVSADGSLAVGVAQGTPNPNFVLVVYDGLSEAVAEAAARGLAQWYRSQGRNIVNF